MADAPWLSIIGLGEDGPDGLTGASRAALERADIVMGPPRHLALLGPVTGETVEWPAPFADGLTMLMDYRGRRVAVLASGDPFWFGAGAVLVRGLDRSEWQAFPGPSAFALAAARLGWPLESTACVALHAAPFARLRPHLAPGARAIVLLRDGEAVNDLANWLAGEGFGATIIHAMEALGGPRERLRRARADAFDLHEIAHPVCAGLDMAGDGAVLPMASGRPDHWFENDGQITKRPVRALTLSALAPRAGEHLWDIGAGSGSIGIEWLLSAPNVTATAIEADPARAARVLQNAARLGVSHRLRIVEGRAPGALADLAPADTIFIGGGLSGDLLEWLWSAMRPGARLVANAVTLESEALLAQWHGDKGGDLLRIELAEASALGRKRGWKAAFPIVQWSVVR